MAGIYFHIPYCKKACHYCNFHFSTTLTHQAELVRSIKLEIERQSDFIDNNEKISTIYFGGGTPSILEWSELESLLHAVKQKFHIENSAEITLECNPDDITTDALQTWYSLGINRLSIGLQSLNDDELKWMNRSHNAEQSKKCIQLIRESSFTNYSADLIFGGPLCSDRDLHHTLDYLIENMVPHVSAYALTAEPRTALYHFIKKRTSPELDTEQQATQFLMVSDKLCEKGYEHYEISNYALPGLKSRHNSSYWKGIPYWGFGPSAHAYDGKTKRRWNVANNALYIQQTHQGLCTYEEETLTKKQMFNEYVMTSLRTEEGVSLQSISEKFGIKSAQELLLKSEIFISKEELIYNEDHLRLTRSGKLMADGIASDLFEDD